MLAAPDDLLLAQPGVLEETEERPLQVVEAEAFAAGLLVGVCFPRKGEPGGELVRVDAYIKGAPSLPELGLRRFAGEVVEEHPRCTCLRRVEQACDPAYDVRDLYVIERG